MEALFSPQYMYLWAAVLALALFLPVRSLIYALYVRRMMRKEEPSESDMKRLKKRAGVTAGLLCFVFAVLYTGHLFRG
jgi:hypothetical protein